MKVREVEAKRPPQVGRKTTNNPTPPQTEDLSGQFSREDQKGPKDVHPCSSGISSVSIVSLSGFGRKVMLASQNESGSIPSSFFGTFKDSK